MESDLCKIIIRYISDKNNGLSISKEDTEYIVKSCDVRKMIISLIKLHINPGINIHNGGKASVIKLILLEKCVFNNYWWSSTDLTGKNKKKCANILETNNQEIIYATKEIMVEMALSCYRDNLGCAYGASLEEPDEKQVRKEERQIAKGEKTYIHEDYQYLFD